MNCPFCAHYNSNSIQAGKHFFLIWDAFPVSDGHLLVIPTRHIEDISEMSDEEGHDLFPAVKAGLQIVKQNYKPDGFNIGMNVGRAAGQTIAHLHFHIIPRVTGDVVDPRGGIRGVIPGKASYSCRPNKMI